MPGRARGSSCREGADSNGVAAAKPRGSLGRGCRAVGSGTTCGEAGSRGLSRDWRARHGGASSIGGATCPLPPARTPRRLGEVVGCVRIGQSRACCALIGSGAGARAAAPAPRRPHPRERRRICCACAAGDALGRAAGFCQRGAERISPPVNPVAAGGRSAGPAAVPASHPYPPARGLAVGAKRLLSVLRCLITRAGGKWRRLAPRWLWEGGWRLGRRCVCGVGEAVSGSPARSSARAGLPRAPAVTGR